MTTNASDLKDFKKSNQLYHRRRKEPSKYGRISTSTTGIIRKIIEARATGS
jgi:bifunctional N-acetylglucosamine-1-phosphate-uridyltransferase/glucosamine-1-phosphate-acetyltransferase GlmU-like protein